MLELGVLQMFYGIYYNLLGYTMNIRASYSIIMFFTCLGVVFQAKAQNHAFISDLLLKPMAEIERVDSKSLIKEIKAEELYLYKILGQARTDLGTLLAVFEQNSQSTQQDPQASFIAKRYIVERLQLVVEQQALLVTIVKGFNAGFHGDHLFYYPEIELKFINACNMHKDIDIEDLKLHHMRALKKKFVAVNRYVKTYCRMHRIKSYDMPLFNNIILFNERIVELVLDEHFFRADWYDSLTDIVYHRPIEFMSEHKALSIAVGVVAAGVFYYYVIKPKWDEYCMYQNLSKIYDMKHLKTVRQDGADCGYHAMLNALIKANCSDSKEAQKFLTDKKLHDTVIGQWKKFIEKRREAYKEAAEEKGFDDKTLRAKGFKHKHGSEWLHVGEIRALLDEDNKMLVPLAQALGVDELEEPFIVERVRDTPNFHTAFYQKSLGNQADAFKRTKKPQHMMVMIPGHYIAVSIEQDTTKKHGVSIELIDSMWGNYTDHDVVTELINLFAQKNALKKVRDKVKKHENFAGIFTWADNANNALDLNHSPQGALRNLRGGINDARQAGLLGNQRVRDRLEQTFVNLRDAVIALNPNGGHHVVIDRDEHGVPMALDIDFDRCATFDQFIEQATGIAGDGPGDNNVNDE